MLRCPKLTRFAFLCKLGIAPTALLGCAGSAISFAPAAGPAGEGAETFFLGPGSGLWRRIGSGINRVRARFPEECRSHRAQRRRRCRFHRPHRPIENGTTGDRLCYGRRQFFGAGGLRQGFDCHFRPGCTFKGFGQRPNRQTHARREGMPLWGRFQIQSDLGQ